MNKLTIRRKIISLLQKRAATSTICPSEVLQLSDRSNPELMEKVRTIAVELRTEGIIEITQKGKRVGGATFKGPIRLKLRSNSIPISTFPNPDLNYRKSPKAYRVAKGEQGVLTVRPYKGELLPLWRFKTPLDAKKSCAAITEKFQSYKRKKDFVGMDMARKFLQMGYTRSRRYANHRSGKKYVGAVPADKKGESGAHGRVQAPFDRDPSKAKSANLFYKAWKKVEKDTLYTQQKMQWKQKYG